MAMSSRRSWLNLLWLAMILLQWFMPTPTPRWFRGACFLGIISVTTYVVVRFTRCRSLPVKVAGVAMGLIFLALEWQRGTFALFAAVVATVLPIVVLTVGIMRHLRQERATSASPGGS